MFNTLASRLRGEDDSLAALSDCLGCIARIDDDGRGSDDAVAIEGIVVGTNQVGICITERFVPQDGSSSSSASGPLYLWER
jgi:hypothetical protein